MGSDRKYLLYFYVKLCLMHMFVTNVLSCCNHFALHLQYIGADPHAKDKIGGTPLMWACANGHKDICALLLEHGEPKQDMTVNSGDAYT